MPAARRELRLPFLSSSLDVEGTLVTPAFQRFWVPPARAELRAQLEPVRQWSELGCDLLAGRGIRWLGSSITHICYTRAEGPSERLVLTVFYAESWRAAHLDRSAF